MSYVNPTLRSRFESLPIELKNEILSRNVHIETLRDLIAVLEDIVREGEADSPNRRAFRTTKSSWNPPPDFQLLFDLAGKLIQFNLFSE